jgi:hypothetical protein
MVLANAGPLMALGKLNRLGLLSGLYGTVHIPRSVYREVVSVGMAQGQPDAFAVRLSVERYDWPSWRSRRKSSGAFERPSFSMRESGSCWPSRMACRDASYSWMTRPRASRRAAWACG